jgi:hypothetical protein
LAANPEQVNLRLLLKAGYLRSAHLTFSSRLNIISNLPPNQILGIYTMKNKLSIALALICILIAASLAATVANYTFDDKHKRSNHNNPRRHK